MRARKYKYVGTERPKLRGMEFTVSEWARIQGVTPQAIAERVQKHGEIRDPRTDLRGVSKPALPHDYHNYRYSYSPRIWTGNFGQGDMARVRTLQGVLL